MNHRNDLPPMGMITNDGLTNFELKSQDDANIVKKQSDDTMMQQSINQSMPTIPMENQLNNMNVQQNINQSMPTIPIENQMMNNQINNNIPNGHNAHQKKVKKHKKKLWIILIISVVLLIIAGIIVFVFINNNSKNNVQETEVEQETVTDNDFMEYNGFALIKQNGYSYSIKDGLLSIQSKDKTEKYMIYVVHYSSNNYKEDDLSTQLGLDLYQNSDVEKGSYNNYQMLTANIVDSEGNNGLAFVMPTLLDDYSFYGVALSTNSNNNINFVDKIISLLQNSGYIQDAKIDNIEFAQNKIFINNKEATSEENTTENSQTSSDINTSTNNTNNDSNNTQTNTNILSGSSANSVVEQTPQKSTNSISVDDYTIIEADEE